MNNDAELVRILLWIVCAMGTTVTALATYVAVLHKERVQDIKDDIKTDMELAMALRELTLKIEQMREEHEKE